MGLQESQLIPILKEAKVPHQAFKKNSKSKKIDRRLLEITYKCNFLLKGNVKHHN